MDQEYSPLDVPLPPIPSVQIFSELQWKTLLSLADTVIPAVRPLDRQSGSASTNTDKLIPEATLNNTISTLSTRIQANGQASEDCTQLAIRFLEESASSLPAFRDSLQRTFTDYVHEEGRNGISLILNALKYFAPEPSLIPPLLIEFLLVPVLAPSF